MRTTYESLPLRIPSAYQFGSISIDALPYPSGLSIIRTDVFYGHLPAAPEKRQREQIDLRSAPSGAASLNGQAAGLLSRM